MSESPHTKTMSETGEIPLTPKEMGEPPQVRRLEDMEEFKKLAPEQQERLLALRERLQNEAMNPRDVVTRSIDEMGFFEGLKETVKPHLAKQKEILFKELKANASLALSLIPVLGEGKGLGTGLFGITVNAEKTVAKGAIKFEPFVRLKKAGDYAKTAYHSGRSVNQIVKYTPIAEDAARLVAHVRPEKAYKAPGRIKTILSGEMKKARDIFSILLSPGNVKHGALGSLGKDFSESAESGAKVIARRLGVEGIRDAQRAKALLKAEELMKARQAAAGVNAVHGEWYKFPVRWFNSARGEVVGRIAAAKAGKEAGKAVTIAVEASIPGYHRGVARIVERGVKRASPTVIEGTKFGKFHAFFDKWLNLTPDVPVWLSTTTGVMEFLGAHGIDAIPAVLQIAHNRYKQVVVTKDMALDVVKYTAMRGLRKLAERKSAAEVFSPTPAMAGAAA